MGHYSPPRRVSRLSRLSYTVGTSNSYGPTQCVRDTRVAKPFDLLSEFAKFGASQKISLRDPATKSAFGLHVGNAIDTALADPGLLHGQRTEAMFESLLVSLGQFRLLKAEDSGRLFPTGQYRAPDFRVVLNDGEQWLIEVKNVYESDPLVQSRRLMTRDYRQSLEDYASVTGAKLKLAVFWAQWSIWTLVSPERLVDAAYPSAEDRLPLIS
jgi:hypothetical protein